MTNPRDAKYANESIARWQTQLKERALLATNNITFACLRGVLHELRARLPLKDIATFGNHPAGGATRRVLSGLAAPGRAAAYA